MTAHAPFPTVRRSAVGLLAVALLTSLAAAVADENFTISLQPADSIVVAGHQVTFACEAGTAGFAQYQWYRNGVAIPGATKQYYHLTAQDADHGALYHVVVSGYSSVGAGGLMTLVGPTPSRQATLSVLAAGTTLTPTITAPDRATLTCTAGNGVPTPCLPRSTVFRATGNNLQWTYRYDNEAEGVWHALQTPSTGAQAVFFNYAPATFASAAVTVRVIDDAGVAATRTWQITQGGAQDGTAVDFGGPGDATVVAGHQVAFFAYTALPAGSSYQWYRNDLIIAGATANPYTFIAQAGDDGARYHVVASGIQGFSLYGPTASPKATLTVLPAGANLPPQIVNPVGDTIYINNYQATYGFRASGNNLAWAYRYNTDAAGTWRALDTTSTGSQYVRINFETYSTPGRTSISVTVTDDGGATATRTWAIAGDQLPTVTFQTVSPNPVRWPGPVTLSVTASDPDGDPLTYSWYVNYNGSVPLGDAVLTPSGNTCTATFTKFGNYSIGVMAFDGKGAYGGASTNIVVQSTFDVRADVNGDGVVNALDLGLILDNFGQVVP